MTSPSSTPDPRGRGNLPKQGARRVALSFGTLDLYPRHVVVLARESAHLDGPEFDAMIAVLKEHFGSRPFGYISWRKHDYSVNPLAGQRVVEQTSVVAGAFIVRSESSRRLVGLEQLFYKRPVEAFDTLEAAEAFIARHLPEEG